MNQTHTPASTAPVPAALYGLPAFLLLWGTAHTLEYGYQPATYIMCGVLYALLVHGILKHATRGHPDRLTTRMSLWVFGGLALTWPAMLVFSVVIAEVVAAYRVFRMLAGGSAGWALFWTVLFFATIGGPLIFLGLWGAYLLVEMLAATPWI